jgi:hypothetical protein
LPVALSIRPNTLSLDALITSAGDRIVFHAWARYFSVKLLIPYHIHRIETVAYPLNLLAQCPPQHGDAGIGRS